MKNIFCIQDYYMTGDSSIFFKYFFPPAIRCSEDKNLYKKNNWSGFNKSVYTFDNMFNLLNSLIYMDFQVTKQYVQKNHIFQNYP